MYTKVLGGYVSRRISCGDPLPSVLIRHNPLHPPQRQRMYVLSRLVAATLGQVMSPRPVLRAIGPTRGGGEIAKKYVPYVKPQQPHMSQMKVCSVFAKYVWIMRCGEVPSGNVTTTGSGQTLWRLEKE